VVADFDDVARAEAGEVAKGLFEAGYREARVVSWGKLSPGFEEV
jgi:hypothetical protein